LSLDDNYALIEIYLNRFNINGYSGEQALVGERLKVLQVLNGITDRVSLKEFAERAELSVEETLKYLQKLERAGYVKRTERRYSITADGKTALKALSPVPKDMEFHFYAGTDKYTGLSAKSFKEFCDLVKKVDVEALKFHVAGGHFEDWLTNVFNDTKLANEIVRIRETKITEKGLRKEISKVTSARYNKFKRLLA